MFQDYLLSTSLTIGGPAEIAYFAQSAVLFERILGYKTPVQPRFSATLIEPAIGELLRRHELTLERVFGTTEDSLAKLLAARAMPIEGKQRLAAAGNALDAELTALLEWMRGQDAGLGRSGETAASKMRYQMNRLRTLAANFQLQREASLGRHAEAISQALFPNGGIAGAAARGGVLPGPFRVCAGRRTDGTGGERLPGTCGAVAVRRRAGTRRQGIRDGSLLNKNEGLGRLIREKPGKIREFPG